MTLTLHTVEPYAVTAEGMSFEGKPAFDRIWVGRDASAPKDVVVMGEHPIRGVPFEIRKTVTANGHRSFNLTGLLAELRALNLGLGAETMHPLVRLIEDTCADAVAEGVTLADLIAEYPAEATEVVDVEPETGPRRRGRTAAELLADVPEDPVWLIPGVLPVGWSIGIAGREKIGKGTWIFFLLGGLERDGTSSYIVSEEPVESLREKVQAFGLTRSRIVQGWEVNRDAPSWVERVNLIVADALADGHRVVFLDNVSRTTGITDESGVELARAVEVLQNACRAAGLTPICDFHHKKGRASIDDKFRGGTAVPGSLDIIIDMERVGPRGSRKRRLTSRGRLRTTIWERVVELSEDGTTYSDVDDTPTLGEALAAYPADSRETYDYKLLVSIGTADVKAFAEKIDRTTDTARRRLNDLVEAGLAEKIKGVTTPEGRVSDTWTAVDPSCSADPYGMQPAQDGSPDSQESA